MTDPKPTPDEGFAIPYATPNPRRALRVRLVAGLVGLGLVLGLVYLAVLLKRGYSMSVRLSRPAMAPATMPTTAPAATPPAATAAWWNAPPSPPSLDLSAGPARMTIVQRGSASIPGSGRSVSVAISDIRRSEMNVNLAGADRTGLSYAKMREGDSLTFSVAGKQFVMVAAEVHTRLLHDDQARFIVRRAEDPPGEEEKIGRLIDAATKRNAVVVLPATPGVSAEPEAAGDYLHKTWRMNRARITTVQDFIREAAAAPASAGAASSTAPTTAPTAPIIRMPDGRETPLDAWLTGELGKVK